MRDIGLPCLLGYLAALVYKLPTTITAEFVGDFVHNDFPKLRCHSNEVLPTQALGAAHIAGSR